MSNNQRDTFQELRSQFDGDETFMTRGHQILAPKATVVSQRDIPAWTQSDEAVRKLLLQVFPKLKTDTRQRESAARWNEVLVLYFRNRMTRGQIAEETNLPSKTVKNIIDAIFRVARGRRADNKPRSHRPRGRPKHPVCSVKAEM